MRYYSTARAYSRVTVVCILKELSLKMTNEIDNQEALYNIGDAVMYRRYGVCRVIAIENQSFGDTQMLYFSLEPVFAAKTKFFVPSNIAQDLSMVRPVFTKVELEKLIEKVNTTELSWENDTKQRIAHFEEIVQKGTAEAITSLFKLLISHKKDQKEMGKTFLDVDKRVLFTVERLVTDEFAFVYDLDKNKALEFVLRQFGLNEDNQ